MNQQAVEDWRRADRQAAAAEKALAAAFDAYFSGSGVLPDDEQIAIAGAQRALAIAALSRALGRDQADLEQA